MRTVTSAFLGITALLCSAVPGLRADTIAVSGMGSSIPSGFCGDFFLCPPLDLTMPQFDPALGTLQSIGFNLSVGQQVIFGINDLADPLIGAPYEVTVVGGITSAGLPVNAQGSEIVDTESNGEGQVGMACCFFDQTLNASGKDSNPLDLAAFEGLAGVDVLFEPFGSAMVTQSVNDWPFAGAVKFIEYTGTLDLAYTYIPVVPEPRGYAVLLGLAFIAAARSSVDRKSQVCRCPNS